MPVHGVSAEDRIAVMAAHDPCSTGSAVQGPPDRARARGANIESAARFHLTFLEFPTFVMIHDVYGGLIIERVMNAR